MSNITGTKFSVRLGLPGGGKSLSMVEEDILPMLLDGVEIWSNFWINTNFPNWHYFTDIEEVLHLRNCVVCFDELGQVLNPREWEKESNDVRLFFQLHRHRHIDIRANTQDISLVAKTALILVEEWIFCRASPSFVSFFLGLFGINWLEFTLENMTFQELKKMANGLNVKKSEEESSGQSNDFDVENLNLEEFVFDNKSRSFSCSAKKLIHKELNHIKKELLHYYCPKCASRQSPMIDRKNNNPALLYCPKHKEQLMEIRQTGIFDTDYEYEITEKPIEWRAFVPSPAGHLRIPFKGALSGRQIEEKMTLPKMN